MSAAVAERFWRKVQVGGPDDCWPWLASLGTKGYGQVMYGRKLWGAHRLAYTLVRGEIPAGLHLDHLCRNRVCVNPAHLEPVTCRTNLLRGETIPAANAAKSHCPQGHPYDEVNTLTYRAWRYCRECNRARSRARRMAGSAS